MKAQIPISSSSDEDACINKNENNRVRQTSAKLMPAYPQIGDFVSSNKKLHIQKSIKTNPTNILRQASTSCAMSGSGE